jgi:tRNA-dihydrouridine synthase 1
VKEAVTIPVFANGNILYQSDIDACLKATGADGVMSAEGQLYNPALFSGLTASHSIPLPSTHDYFSDAQILSRHPLHADLALEYLTIVQELKTRTSVSGIKGHLFKIMQPGLAKEVDLRDRLGRAKVDQKKGGDQWLKEYVDICQEMKTRMDVSCLFIPFVRSRL